MKTNIALTLALVCLTLSICQQSTNQTEDQQIFQEFQDFVRSQNKNYTSLVEMQARYKVFQENRKAMKQKWDKKGNYSVGYTQFADLLPQEFSKTYLSLELDLNEILRAQTSEDHTNSTQIGRNLNTLPNYFNWADRGAISRVKNQGSCGGCWAFAAVSNIESLYFIKYGQINILSTQQVLNCANSNWGNFGCNGGNAVNAYRWAMNSNGVGLAVNLLWTGTQGACTNVAPVARVTGFNYAGTTNEDSIANWLMNNGPLSVAVNAKPLQFYTGGIIDLSANDCNPSNLNHAVVLVGFGVTTTGVKYWIVLNSWGDRWGENGYFRLARGKGTCGINQYVTSSIIG